MKASRSPAAVRHAFENAGLRIPIADIMPLRQLTPAILKSVKYAQIAASGDRRSRCTVGQIERGVGIAGERAGSLSSQAGRDQVQPRADSTMAPPHNKSACRIRHPARCFKNHQERRVNGQARFCATASSLKSSFISTINRPEGLPALQAEMSCASYQRSFLDQRSTSSA